MNNKERLNRIKEDIDIIEKEVLGVLKKMKQLRELKNTAEKVGVHLQYLSNYLNGRIKISEKKLFDMADKLF